MNSKENWTGVLDKNNNFQVMEKEENKNNQQEFSSSLFQNNKAKESSKKPEVTFEEKETSDIVHRKEETSTNVDDLNEEKNTEQSPTEKNGDDENSDTEKTEENNEENQEPPELTFEEKKAINEAVKDGDIDLLDDLLDIPGADINMEWYGENLLMTAIRNQQQEMAEFLIDNGIDYNFESVKMECVQVQQKEEWKFYKTKCRAMAYEYNMWDLIEIIDELNGEMWPFIKPKPRQVRLKRPLEEKMKERGEWIEEEEEPEQEGMDNIIEDEQTSQIPDNVSKQNEQIDNEDDKSSGYETLSSSQESPPMPKITHIPVDAPTIRAHFQANKAFLSRKSCSAFYKSFSPNMPKEYISNLRRERTDILKNSIWPKDASRSVSKQDEKTSTRILSPWKPDDPLILQNLRIRSQNSSNRIVLDSKPLLVRSKTFDFSIDHNLGSNTLQCRRPSSESTLHYRKPLKASTNQAIFKHSELVRSKTADSVLCKMSNSSEKINSRTRTHKSYKSAHSGGVPVRANHMKTAWSSPSFSLLDNKNGPRKYSPAGVMKTSRSTRGHLPPEKSKQTPPINYTKLTLVC